MMLSIFSCSCWTFVCLFRSSAHFLIELYFFFILSCMTVIWKLSTFSHIICRYFLPYFRLSFCFVSEKAMAPHSSTLAWKIPWMEEPGRLQSMGLWRVGYDWATSLSLSTFMHWRRKWQPTPVFLLGESQGRGSLMGCRLWGRTELDMTEMI